MTADSQTQHKLARQRNDRHSYLLPDHWVISLRDNVGLWWLDHEAYVERVCDIVQERGAQTVLEVGCGDGWNCARLADRGLEVVGCDWSRNAIAHAARLVPKGRFYCGDVTDPGFKRVFSEQFDAIVMVEVIEHIPPEACAGALANMLGFLREGGTFVLTTPSVNQPNTNPQHYRHFDEATLRAEVTAVKAMEVVAVEGYGDARFEKAYHNVMRFFDNRLYRIKPLKRWLDDSYRRAHARQTPIERSRGLIMTSVKGDSGGEETSRQK